MTATKRKPVEPLLESPCMACGEPLGAVKDGWVEWRARRDENDLYKTPAEFYGFRVVHRRCHYPRPELDMHLDFFCGWRGLQRLADVVGEKGARIDGEGLADVMDVIAETIRLGIKASKNFHDPAYDPEDFDR